MNSTMRSIQVIGIYAVLLGLGLICIPNTLLGIFNLEPTREPWIRVLGIIVAEVGYYYVTVAMKGSDAFFRASIFGRFWLFAVLIVMIVLGIAKPILLLLASIDAASAVWTWKTLRTEGTRQ
jgi:hypothetical protein